MDNQIDKIFGYTTDELFQITIQYGTKVISAVAVLLIGFWIANFLARTVRRIMTKSKADANLVGFISSLVAGLVKTLVVVTAITQLGIEMTSFVAILGAAGLAVGMAFSGTLSNFAGGVMILLFKQFKSGDYVLVAGQEGKVREVTIFNTIITTSDNKVVILPNGPVANGTITNFSTSPNRRLDWKITLSDADNFYSAKSEIASILSSDKRILKSPAYFIGMADFSATGFEITIRAWVSNANRNDVFFELNERFYKEVVKNLPNNN